MKNKVKVTVEQKVLIERLNTMDCFKVDVVSYVAKKEKIPNSNYRPLEGLTLAELLKVLYEPNSYEVGLQYNVGDWVVREDGEYFKSLSIAAKVTEVKKHRLILDGQMGSYTYEYIRHATKEEIKLEKERLFWKSIDREVGEFEDGDVITKVCGKSYVVERKPDEGQSKEWYEQGNLKGFYPVESFISFEEL